MGQGLGDKRKIEMQVRARKLWCNVKECRFWGLAVLAVCVALVCLMTLAEHQADKKSASLDTYQGEGLVFIDSDDEDYSDAYNALVYSERIRTQLNDALLGNGFEEFDKKQDTVNVDRKGKSMCYRVIVRSVGLERTRFLAGQSTELLVREAESIMGLKGVVIDEPVMSSYLTRSDGRVETFKLGKPKAAGVSVGDFFTWKKIMILGCGLLLWCAMVKAKVFSDITLRSKIEIGHISPVPCFCEVKMGDRESYGLLAALLDAVREETGEKQACFLSPGAGRELTTACQAVNEILEERRSDVRLSAGVRAAFSPQTVKEAGASGRVYLWLSIDEDNILDAKKAFANLTTVGRNLGGYIVSGK